MDDKARDPSPPYTSWPSMKTLIGTVSEQGLPGRIDRSMLKNFSGSVAGQLLTALRFLGLTDDAGHPTAAMPSLVGAYGTDGWPGALAVVLKEAYAPLFQLNLASASPAQFNEAFRKAFTAEGDTFRKCVTFFLSAAKEAQISVSPYIMQNKKPRLGPVKRRAPKAEAKTPKADGGGGGKPRADFTPPPLPPSSLGPEQMLLALLDPENMDEKEQTAIWTLLLYLKRAPK